MGDRGIIFSVDFTVAGIVLLISLFILLSQTNGFVSKNAEVLKHAEFQRKVVFLADSMVKNHDKKNFLHGMASFNLATKRAESNTLNTKDLTENGVSQNTVAGLKVTHIALRFFGKPEQEIFKKEVGQANKCLVSERFVLLENYEKAVLAVTACE